MDCFSARKTSKPPIFIRGPRRARNSVIMRQNPNDNVAERGTTPIESQSSGERPVFSPLHFHFAPPHENKVNEFSGLVLFLFVRGLRTSFPVCSSFFRFQSTREVMNRTKLRAVVTSRILQTQQTISRRHNSNRILRKSVDVSTNGVVLTTRFSVSCLSILSPSLPSHQMRQLQADHQFLDCNHQRL